MVEISRWLEGIMNRLPLIHPGTLVASEEGVGVFMGNWLGGNRAYGVKRGDRVVVEMYLTWE